MTLLRPAIIAALMLAASIGAITLKPTTQMADQRAPLLLEQAVPERFGSWVVDFSIVPIAVSPDVQARLNVLYNQTLNRTYINSRGQQIMLSIAYGRDQGGEGTQVHRPEFCYTSQGFQVHRALVQDLQVAVGLLPVQRLSAQQGRRHEPITYWIIVGERATLPGLGRKLNQIAYGLSGTVPDGMLVRVSSIDANDQHAYAVHDEFINNMLSAMKPEDQARFAGQHPSGVAELHYGR